MILNLYDLEPIGRTPFFWHVPFCRKHATREDFGCEAIPQKVVVKEFVGSWPVGAYFFSTRFCGLPTIFLMSAEHSDAHTLIRETCVLRQDVGFHFILLPYRVPRPKAESGVTGSDG